MMKIISKTKNGRYWDCQVEYDGEVIDGKRVQREMLSEYRVLEIELREKLVKLIPSADLKDVQKDLAALIDAVYEEASYDTEIAYNENQGSSLH